MNTPERRRLSRITFHHDARLAIAATEQRRGDRTSACLPPPPISYAYRWAGDRYQRDDSPLAGAPCH